MDGNFSPGWQVLFFQKGGEVMEAIAIVIAIFALCGKEGGAVE